MHHIHKTVLIFLLTLSLSLTLFCDDFFAIKDRILKESRFKLGFVYITPLILLQNVGYTSSIYTYEEREYPDWTGDLGVGVRASAIAANRFIFQAEEMPYYSFYLENENLRTWSNRFSATGYSHLGPLDLKAGFSRDDLRQRPRLEFGRPYRLRDTQWSGVIDAGDRGRFFVTAYAKSNEYAYDDDPYLDDANLAQRLNHREEVLGVKLNKRVFTSTVVYLGYEHTDYRFGFSDERDAQAQRVALGIEFPEMGRLQGSLELGLKRFDPGNPLYRQMQKLNGKGEVSLTLAERLRFSFNYGIDTLFSYGASDLFYDNESFGFAAEAYVTRFLKAGASFQDGRLRYHSFLDLQLQRRDRTRQQQYTLAFPFIGRTAIGLAYNVYRLTSDALGLDYSRNFWGGFLSYEF